MNISLCILTRDEEATIGDLVLRFRPHMEEMLVIDDGSIDSTRSRASQAGATVISLPFKIQDKGFAEARNFMNYKSSKDWILHIDADEFIAEDEVHILDTLMRYSGKNVWTLPRRKWVDYKK